MCSMMPLPCLRATSSSTSSNECQEQPLHPSCSLSISHCRQVPGLPSSPFSTSLGTSLGSRHQTLRKLNTLCPKIARLWLTRKNDLTVVPTKFLKIILPWVVHGSSCEHFKAPAVTGGSPPPPAPFQLGNTTINQQVSFLE